MSYRKKSLKRMFGDFMTILTIVAIFAFSIFCITFIAFVFISAPAQASTDKFQEALQYAKSLKNTVSTEKMEKEANKNILKVGSFRLEPEKIFRDPKTKNSWYTDMPVQTGYYDTADTHIMEKDAKTEIAKDDGRNDADGNSAPTPGKAVINGFQTRPIYKVTNNDDYMVKSNRVIKNSKYIITGKLDGDVKCVDKEKQVKCESTYEQKTCNEEVRTVKRICEKVPQITFIDDALPGCQKHVSPPAIEDCLASGVQIPHYRGTGYGKVVIPKNRGARVGFSDSRHPYYYITATNETTGELVIPRRQVSNGYYIELPISKNQDQTFSFVVERWDRCTCDQPGRMNVYINYMRKIPKIEWLDGVCHDI